MNSSVVDNQPVSILEAFAAGLPVVSTPTGDIAAMLRGGQAGLLVGPEDPAAMAEAVTRLLDQPDLAARIISRARQELDGGWVLNGSKNFITNATFAATTVVLAITDRAAASHGISAFIVELKRYARARLKPYQVPVRIQLSPEAQHSARFKRMRRSAN